jgi:DNA-binding MarR family transcriptional regulator
MSDQQFSENQNTFRENLLQQLIEGLFSIMKQIHRDAGPHDHSLSPPQARLIFVMAKYPDKGLSVKELAKIVDITPGAITQFMDVLIKKNLVIREEDADDRRIVRLKLTPEANKQMEKVRHTFLTASIQKFKVLNDDELKQLNDLLAKVCSQPQKKDCEG